MTLVGPPGIGKSRLAAELIARRPDPADVGYAALAEVGEDDDLAATIAVAMGVPPATLREAGPFEAAPDLLVIDNAEHLRSGVAAVATLLLRAPSRPTVLCTSRTPLGVAAEQVVDLGPLDPAAAVDLYTARAERAGAPGARDPGLIAEICRRLDQLPLAIEIAASWARSLGDRDVLDRLGVALRTEPVMAGTIGASLDRLTATQRDLLGRLTVCSGAFDLFAAGALAEPDTDVTPDLVALVDQSLVVPLPEPDTGRMRYRLLEPLRQQVSVRFPTGRLAEAAERHARHFADLARRWDRELRGPDPVAVRGLQQDEGNLLAAGGWARRHDPQLSVDLAIDLARYWECRGRVDDARRRLQGALDLAGDELTPQRLAVARSRLGLLAWRHHDFAGARAAYAAGLATRAALGDERGVARALRDLALVDAQSGRTVEARANCEHSLALCRRIPDTVGEGWAMTVLAVIEFEEGRDDEGRACSRRALEVSGPSRPDALTVAGHLHVAYGDALAGDTAGHRHHLAAAAVLLTRTGPPLADPDWLWAGSHLAAVEGRAPAALRLAGAAENLARGGKLAGPTMKALCDRGTARARARVGARSAARYAAQGARLSTDRLLAQALQPPSAYDRPLTERELEVADLVGRGLGNEEIARILQLSRRTVESHVDHCRRKLELPSRLALVSWAVERRLEREPESG